MGYATAIAQPGPIGVVPTGLNLSMLNPALPPIADVYVGQLADPVLPRPGRVR